MWMGFLDQQTNGSAPARDVVTFAGTSHAHLTTANPGDYFDNGAILHLAHTIEDLAQFYSNANAQAISTFNGEHRMGHLSGLDRSSRASGSASLHIRDDGPGFDSVDVPGGSKQPVLQFAVFVPTAEFFRVMRVNPAAELPGPPAPQPRLPVR